MPRDPAVVFYDNRLRLQKPIVGLAVQIAMSAT